MKSKSILTIMLLASISASAQTELSFTPSVTGTNIGGGTGLFPHFVNNGGGSQNNNDIYLRLVGKTKSGYGDNIGFKTIDSTAYEFSGDRGGVISADDLENDEAIFFDEAYTYKTNIIGNTLTATFMRDQTYNADNKITILKYAQWRKHEWQDSSRYVYNYDNNKMTASAYEQMLSGMWTNPISSTITYTGNNVTEMSSVIYKVSFAYDNNNNLISRTDAEYQLGSAWQNREKNTFTYNGSTLVAQNLEVWNNNTGNWENSKHWDYTYAGTNIATYTEQRWINGSWQNYDRILYTYDAYNYKTSELTQKWSAGTNTFENAKQVIFEYNTLHLPTVVTTTSWDGSAWTNKLGDEQYHFYYQVYFPTKVERIVKNEMNIYPIPASDVVNINLNWEKPTDFTVSICDVKGAVLSQWNERFITNYAKAVSVNNLPAGSYFIRINSDEQNIVQQLVVRK